jgi:hypothetical protein
MPTCEFGEESGLADGGEANHAHPGVSGLGDLKALPGRSALLAASGFDEFALEFGQLGLEQAQVIGGGLVLLRALHFGLDLCDLLSCRHSGPKLMLLINGGLSNTLPLKQIEAIFHQLSINILPPIRSNYRVFIIYFQSCSYHK